MTRPCWQTFRIVSNYAAATPEKGHNSNVVQTCLRAETSNPAITNFMKTEASKKARRMKGEGLWYL